MVMNNWTARQKRLKEQLNVLPDKPEETAESTLKALWMLAAGEPLSAQKAINSELPDLATNQLKTLDELIEKRISGIPLAHLTGRQQFMGVELLAGPGALVPRKETELLGFGALDRLRELAKEIEQELLLIDVCTGAGNLAVALGVLFQSVQIYAADLSPEAVSLAKKNVEFNNLEGRVQILISDVLDAFDTSAYYRKVDMLICNPPYISAAKVEEMPAEISKFEPRLAFDGGAFGIKVLTKLTNEAPKFLRTGGWLGFEVGLGQGAAMLKRLEKSPYFLAPQSITDKEGNIRALFAQRNEV